MGFTLFADGSAPASVEVLDSGAVRVKGNLCRTGVQSYAPWKGARIQGRPIRIYRPPEEVFSDASLATLKSIPVTIGHPKERSVNPSNWKKYAKGHIEGHEAIKAVDDSGDFIQTGFIISDGDTIPRVIDSKELCRISQGYSVDLDWTPGVTDSGEKYDAVQRNIRHNHTALLGVGQARAGEGACVLLDEADLVDAEESAETENMTDEDKKDLVKMVLDALDAREPKQEKVEQTDAREEAPKVESKEEVVDSKEEAVKAAEEAAIKLLDSRKKEEIKAQALIDTKDAAKKMLPEDYAFKGKTAKEIQLDCLERHMPGEDFTDASDAVVEGSFRALKHLETQYVSDSKEAAKPADHFKEYNDRMNARFTDSWEKAKNQAKAG